MKVTKEVITPEVAQYYLKGNVKNRRLSAKRVANLADEIKSGRWQLNGESIKFNGEKLLDGQHRLNAVVVSELPIETLVMRGVSEDAFETIDTGKKRTGADVLGISGEKNAAVLAASLGIVHRHENGRIKDHQSISHGELRETLERHPGLRHSVKVYAKRNGLVQPSIAAALHYLFSKKDARIADEFFQKLLTGCDLAPGDPVLALREKLMKHALSKATKLSPKAVMALVVKAWNATRRNLRLTRLYYTEGKERFPAIK